MADPFVNIIKLNYFGNITESWLNAIQVYNYLNMVNIRIKYLESYS